ncbi:MAG: S-layer protein [Candidatus Aenigmatarchaeota archaeon]
MPYFVEDGEEKAFKCLVIEPRNLKVLSSELSLRILEELSKQPSCAMDIARKLKQHEQKIYYHLRRLEEAGIIRLEKKVERVGAVAKIYSVSSPYIAVKLFDAKPLEIKARIKESEFLGSFIQKGKLNAIIVVGSPDPHGRYGAQASDGSAAIDLALFLGTFLESSNLNYKLDTQIREEDLQKNLILIGGPKANILIDKINDRLPIYFDTKHDFNIVSSLSKTVYVEDEIGIVVKTSNPFARGKEILVLSGKRFKGTRAAIVALVKYPKKVAEGNKFNGGFARVVKGIDRDADGIIDDVEFLE